MKAYRNISLFGIYSYLLLTSIISPGQGKNQNTFIKQVSINGSQTNRGVTIEEIPGEGYILTGLTSGGDAGGEDVFLMKIDEDGATSWIRTFGGPGDDHGWAVRQTTDGGYIIVGFTDSFGAGGSDVYLIKTNSEGDKLWEKTFGGAGDEYGWDVRTTLDGGFIIASQTNSSGNGKVDAYLIKVDNLGNEEWSVTYGGTQTDRIFSVQQTKEGGFIAAGITYSYASVSQEDRDGYILKVDAAGNEEWYYIIGEDGYDVAHCVALTSDNGYLVTGYGESYSESGGMDIYLIKVNEEGKELWTLVVGDAANERGIKGEQTKDEGFVATGFTDKARDLLLVRTDRLGEKLWTRTYGEIGYLEFGYTVKETIDGGFILIGHKENLESRRSEIYLIKTDANGMVN